MTQIPRLQSLPSDASGLRLLQAASGRRSLWLHLVIVLVLLVTAQGFDGSIHATGHWVVLAVYALCSISLGLADWRSGQRGGEGVGRGETGWLAWTATLLNAGLALFVVVEHVLLGATEAEETAAAVSRLPAFLLLLQTGLSMRLSHTAAFTALVGLGWGGTILFAVLRPDSALLGPHVTLDEEVPGLLTFLAAGLVVLDGMRRLHAAMAAALHMEAAAVRMEHERTVLARFVPDRVAVELAREGGLGAVQSRHACLFALDIRGFSAFTRTHAPDAVVRALLAIRALAHEAITEQGGIVDKYVGDGVLAQFILGSPDAQARAALACARALSGRIAALNARRLREGAPALGITIALHAGDLLVGVFDDGHRAEFTVLGAPMNLLARIEARAKAANLAVAASETFLDRLATEDRQRLRLTQVPDAGCSDLRALRLFAVAWDPERA